MSLGSAVWMRPGLQGLPSANPGPVFGEQLVPLMVVLAYKCLKVS